MSAGPARSHSSGGSDQSTGPQEETVSSVDGDEGIGSLIGSPSPDLSAEDAEKEAKVRSVLLGKLDDLPFIPSKIVRIFTSSTFTDTTLERNALMENVYPKLKEYCREKYGLEFQVVDMRWGVRDEATDDHMTTELCMKEIENCQRLSVGPNFVVFLGQKYGYRPIPTYIPATEFELLREVIGGVKTDKDLLDKWYKRDDNEAPPLYVLQPISTILTNFNNKRHQRLMEADQNSWWEIMGRLQKMLRKAAQVLLMARKLDREQMHNYFMSVTEREVRKGIINYPDVKGHCLAYVRMINNMNLALIRFARNFIDMAARDVDHEAQKFLSTLRDDKLAAKMPPTDLIRYEVEWTGKEGIDVETHREYLKVFCENFYHSMMKLIDDGVIANRALSEEAAYGENLQHLHSCSNIVRMFKGREEILDKIKDYMLNDNSAPLMLHGEGGCGKTALLAKAYSMIHKWLPSEKQPLAVLRFLGTSPHSSSVIPLLRNLSEVICLNYPDHNKDNKDEIPTELSPLVQYFRKLIQVAEEDKPLIIMLDSLDHLTSADGAHTLAWLPIHLPPYVKIIVSTLSAHLGIIDVFQRLVPIVTHEENYIQISPLGDILAMNMLRTMLSDANRTFVDSQAKTIRDALSKCNYPLFVKLVFDEVCRWRSYSKFRTTTLAHNIHDSIMKLLDRIENQHGRILVQHALGYLTAAKSGLSEAELEDLLSLDEKVLNDVYQYHLPPVRRIPPLLWTRIRNDLPGYFSEFEADGVNVINWYHKQFMEASRERYFKNLNFLSEIHSNIADFFLGIWGGCPKPFEYSELQRQRFFLDDTKGESDRKVPEQPLYYTDVMGRITRFNYRKLSEMPFHLLRSQRLSDLYSEVLFNFRFLHAKLSALPLTALLADFEETLDTQYDRNLKIVADTLRLSASILSQYPDMLGPQIVGRLLPYFRYYDRIRSLIQQVDTDGLQINALVPSFHCLHTPGGPLQFSLEGHPFAPFGIDITSDYKYLVSVSNIFILWDLTTGDVYRQVVPGIQGIIQNLSISPDDKTAIGYTNNNQIVVCYLMTGEFNVFDIPIEGSSDNLIGTVLTNTHILAWSFREWFYYTLDGKQLMQQTTDKNNGMLVHMLMGKEGEKYLVMKAEQCIPGVESESDMTLEVHNGATCSQDAFDFHSAIAITKDRSTVYACIAISDECVACYKKGEDSWKYDRTLGNNDDKIFSLMLSEDENFLSGTVALGYKLWNLKTDKQLDLKLPQGVRNIPSKYQLTCLVVFTKNNMFMVAAVRRNIYVWDVKVGNLVKTLDAHFGRIIAMVTVPSANKIISSSIDKTIKVWNFDNILEDVHSIFRHDKPIDAISLAPSALLAATTTRNCVGIWSLEDGRLLKTLANSTHSSIVTHAQINLDGTYVVSAESGNVLIWDVGQEKVLHSDPQRDVYQLIMSDNDTKAIVLSKKGAIVCRCACRSIPEGKMLYDFEYNIKKFKNAVVTCDGLFLVVPAYERNTDVLSLYHAKTGTKMYDVTVKYSDYKEFHTLVAMPHDAHLVAMIDTDKGNIYDVKKKHFVRTVRKWNGVCTRNGKFGLFAPNRGGLEMLDLKKGGTKHVMIPRVAEGVHNTKSMFTKPDTHVVYYHAGRRSIRVFRTSDGKQIADYKAHAEITSIQSTDGGTSIVLGAVDGSLVVLAIADPKNDNTEYLNSLPSRQLVAESPEHSPTHEQNRAGVARSRLGTMAQVARAVAISRKVTQSRACVLS